MLPEETLDEARTLLAALEARGETLATAESCTGGLIAATLTEIAGSSDVVERGYVTYSNEAKIYALGVPAEIVAGHGAVSEPVARAMAEGALRKSNAHIAIACTGIAGPGGATNPSVVSPLVTCAEPLSTSSTNDATGAACAAFSSGLPGLNRAPAGQRPHSSSATREPGSSSLIVQS